MSTPVRTTLTFALLMGAYLGYTRGFAVVASRIRPDVRAVADSAPMSPSLSRGAKEAMDLALRVFGEGHWATHDVKRYYNVERGYWMYWSKFERPDDKGGKRIEFSPFAVIWRSKDDASVKVISGDRAIVDFEQPFDLLKSGPKPKVVYARIEGTKDQVSIQDDKGTTDPADDLIVTMPYAEYFEKDSQIRCDQDVHLTERDVTVQGTGLVMGLRPSEGGQGFPGAEKITLQRHVVMKAEDVGRTGIMPGAARPEQQTAAAGTAPAKTPVELLCDGEFVLRLPRPSRPVLMGPPAPAPPTIATFNRNVQIRRGAGLPDQINGDVLTAILVPRERPAAAVDAAAAAKAEPPNSMGGLTLLEARVEGHAVWLQSEAERLKVRGNELIYRKPGVDLPEESYFRADPGKQLYMERVEVDEKGDLKSLMIVYATDATLRGSPQGKGGSSIVARGPGWLEQRSGPNRPVERWASWKDELIVDDVARPDAAASEAEPGAKRTYITLKGYPIVEDPSQVTMASRDEMVICLKDRPKVESESSTALASQGAEKPAGSRGDAYQIEWITAHGDVHMITPETTPEGTPSSEGRRTMNARDQLQVVFEYPEPAPPTATEPGPDSNPIRRVSLVQVSPATADQAAPGQSLDAQAPAAGAEERKESQGLDVEADVVWARVVMDRKEGLGLTATGPKSKSAGRDVREVRLRGNVKVHQDAEEGQEQGMDLWASAVDVTNNGPGRLTLYAHGEGGALSRLVTPEMTIEGPMLGAEQARDYAWVRGAGTLTMQSGGSALDGMLVKTGTVAEDGRISEKATARKMGKPAVIRWKEMMQFHGAYPDEQGRPGPARALFVTDVDARMGDDRVACQEMEAVLDRQVDFDRSMPGPSADGGETGERPDIDSVMCWQDVRIGSWMRDERGGVRELREVHGQSVRFQRPTGAFWVDNAGTVLLTGYGKPGEAGRGEAGVTTKDEPALTQTRVDFRKGMEGQVGMDDAGKPDGYREATFHGDVQVLRAPVADFRTRLSHDKYLSLPEFLAMDADRLELEQDPAVPAVQKLERTVMRAYGKATARTPKEVMQGDTIVYDSQTDLIYIRGTNGRVIIQNQEGAGQVFGQADARAVVYNPRTNQFRMLEPGAMRVFDPGSLGRIGSEKPTKEKPKKKVKRPEPKLPPSSNLERRNYTGR